MTKEISSLTEFIEWTEQFSFNSEKNAKAGLIDAQKSGIDIINLFSRYHRTIVELEEEIEVQLPKDIAAMLMKE